VKSPDILAAAKPVCDAFEVLQVPYYIGGSIASSAYGIARATLDVDIVANLRIHHVQPLVNILEAGYYLDEAVIIEAIRRHSSFNLIHLETMLKVDVFISKSEPYHREIFQRIRQDSLDEDLPNLKFYLASPEDVILSKLDWFRLGGKTSERQWNDILGVLKVQKELLDLFYLKKWAVALGISDLLEKALSEAGF
jgi:hypothetical protein